MISNERILIADIKEGSVILDINIRENIYGIFQTSEKSNDDLLAIISEITLVGEFDVEVEQETTNLEEQVFEVGDGTDKRERAPARHQGQCH